MVNAMIMKINFSSPKAIIQLKAQEKKGHSETNHLSQSLNNV